LLPYPKLESYNFLRIADIRLRIQAFLAEQPLAEFSNIPILVFAIADGAFGQTFRPHINLVTIFPSIVHSMKIIEIKALAFHIYSQIRTYFSFQTPFPELEQLFFGYRYEPPFVLGRPDESTIVIHFAWNSTAGLAIATDDTGAILTELQLMSVSDIGRFIGALRRQLTGLHPIFSLGIMGEFLYDTDLTNLSRMGDGVFIYSILPCSAVQITTDFDCNEDVYVRVPQEQIHSDGGECAPPLASAIVLAKGHCSYQMSLYVEPRKKQSGDSLEWLAGQFSRLSWLSVLPGKERRVAALPPHFAALLRRTQCSVASCSRFEFL
jgi:hypothetical protein